MKRLALVFMVMALASFIGCNQQPTGSLEVVSVFPTDGYHGFKKDDVITIEFNAPVDLNSFLQAYISTSDGLRPEEISYTVANDGKKIIIYPGKPLDYSSTSDYVNYGFELREELTDLDGRHLAEPLRVSFTTMRTLTATIFSSPELDGSATDSLVVASGSQIMVGDNTNDAQIDGFLAFPWPEENDGVLAASLRLPLALKQNTPFADLGPLDIEVVDLGESLDLADIRSTALLPAITDDGSTWTVGDAATYDVIDFARKAWDQGLGRLDLRLHFDATTDNDGTADAVYFYAREYEDTAGADLLPALDLTYYGP